MATHCGSWAGAQKRSVHDPLFVGGAVTVSATVAVAADTPLPLAVSVTVASPTGVAPDVRTVAVTTDAVVGDSLTVTVAPAGRPVAARVTGPVKLVRAMVAVIAALAPCTTLTAAGDAVRARLAGGGSTVTAIVVAATTAPAEALTGMV